MSKRRASASAACSSRSSTALSTMRPASSAWASRPPRQARAQEGRCKRRRGRVVVARQQLVQRVGIGTEQRGGRDRRVRDAGDGAAQQRPERARPELDAERHRASRQHALPASGVHAPRVRRARLDDQVHVRVRQRLLHLRRQALEVPAHAPEVLDAVGQVGRAGSTRPCANSPTARRCSTPRGARARRASRFSNRCSIAVLLQWVAGRFPAATSKAHDAMMTRKAFAAALSMLPLAAIAADYPHSSKETAMTSHFSPPDRSTSSSRRRRSAAWPSTAASAACRWTSSSTARSKRRAAAR